MNSRRLIVAPDAEGTTIVTEQLIALEGPMSALGQKQVAKLHVRFTPNSDIDCVVGQVCWANSGHGQQKCD
jgi:hypothetical protein